MSRPPNEQAQINAKNADEIYERICNEEGIFECITLWLDLLGFKHHMDNNKWELHREETKIGLRRIAAFHEVALTSMNDQYEVVQLNDSIVISQDIPPVNPTKAIEEFLVQIDYIFETAAYTEDMINGKGVRGVISVGSRYDLRGNLGWTKEGKKNPEKPAFFSPRPIMMNMAFGRAYGAESSHQLDKDTSLYIEKNLFDNYSPKLMETWKLDKMIELNNFGKFFKVRSIEF